MNFSLGRVYMRAEGIEFRSTIQNYGAFSSLMKELYMQIQQKEKKNDRFCWAEEGDCMLPITRKKKPSSQ